ncbi:XrtN system VIT domain-containing protein [Dyadobacter fermentans]|uniref:XrtN system VIT domain-containing protein n=1 Tax=Dyadobacter fermentans TaxID=94254 RepID=UPI001CBB7E74|nr:XrtN system VIT domain-containing protein [Dyadobacter fermentans]MBZ1356941.1 XrtN system VIT domain-containing protein [Dyadobacter fermentans]
MQEFTVHNPQEPILSGTTSVAEPEIAPRFDFDYGVGLGCLLFSFSIFYYTSVAALTNGAFVLPWSLAAMYSVWLMNAGKLRWFWKKQPPKYLHHRLLLGYVWLVSCFTLNRSIPVFDSSAPWLMFAIVIAGASAILFTWEKYLRHPLKSMLFALMGCSAVIWLYYALCLIPYYLLSIPALLLLGISVHSFVPLLLSITYLRVLALWWGEFRPAILTGVIIPIAITVYFSVTWRRISNTIRYQTNATATQPADDLPNWVMLARQIEDDWITRRVLMGSKVYQVADSEGTIFSGRNTTDMVVRHDPLVLIASLFTQKLDLADAEQINILNVLYDTRHETQERLWSGSDLRTANVLTHARIYPHMRLAYTEKTISIANHSGSSRWQEEALYTFFLPEGSVVSALSLWINGIEQKSLLTSQSKADSAYKTIVGVESRDPSVAHWQEGNMVKVKVFPCTARENRKFKLGITTPLKADGSRLTYENIWFKGPGAEKATETIRLEFPQGLPAPHLPFEPTNASPGVIVHEGAYQSVWQARFKITPVGKESFAFGGKTYIVEPLHKTLENFKAKTFYLDINQAWSERELNALWPVVRNRPVFVANERLIRLTEANKDEQFKALSAFNFSLFPVQYIPDPENALLITKSTAVSPTLRDLANAPFSKTLSRHAPQGLRTFLISDDASTYIKSLNELSIVRAKKTSWKALQEMISQNQFPADPEADLSVVSIESADIQIRETEGPASGHAPDHLLRLFAYNHIMKQLGGRFLNHSFQTDSVLNAKLIREAETAHIVSPVSSMVVLEARQDYDRFDIRKSKNSLDNATLKTAGAVPEPHEWLLIILFCILAGYFTFRHYVR